MTTEEEKGLEMKKTTLELPEILWHAAKYRAGIEHVDLRIVVARALEAYLKTTPAPALRVQVEAKKPSGVPRYIDLFPKDLRGYIESVYGPESKAKKGGKS